MANHRAIYDSRSSVPLARNSFSHRQVTFADTPRPERPPSPVEVPKAPDVAGTHDQELRSDIKQLVSMMGQLISRERGPGRNFSGSQYDRQYDRSQPRMRLGSKSPPPFPRRNQSPQQSRSPSPFRNNRSRSPDSTPFRRMSYAGQGIPSSSDMKDLNMKGSGQ